MTTVTSDGDALLLALNEWRMHHHRSVIRWMEVADSSVSSCAELQVLVGHHGDDLDRCVMDLMELLDLVELSTRGRMTAQLLHRLVDHDADECPMRQRWCSFCDGVDRRVVLTLTPKPTTVTQNRQSFLAVVRRALYESNDSTASPVFLQLRNQLLSLERYTEPTQPKRSRPIELKIDVDSTEELESFLKAATDQRRNAPLFRVSMLQTTGLDHHAMAPIAASQVPVEMKEPFDWIAVVHDEQEDVTTSVLATTNVRALHADATSDEYPVERLLETLRYQSSQLKELRLELNEMPEYGYTDEDDECRAAFVKRLGQTLFGVDSTLRLETLALTANLCEQDLQHMMELTPQSLSSSSQGTVRHQLFSLWSSELSTVQGATLGRLLMRSGSVTSLVLDGRSALSIAQVTALVQNCPSLQSLKVKVSCLDWKAIPLKSNSPDDVSIKHLELQLVDRTSSMIAKVVPRLLSVFGGSIESLSILPRRSSALLKADLAAAIVQHCPQIENLHVRNADDSFITRLFESLRERPCKLKNLCLVAGDANVDYDALVAALSTATHPVSRVLRSLEIDVCGWGDDDVHSLGIRLREMLKSNKKLHDVTLVAYETWPRDDEATARGGGLASAMPPLRHRLAALSVLRRLSLPVAIQTDILTMAGRPVHRFWLERRYESSHSDDSEGDEDY